MEEIIVPLLNANEPEARIVKIYVSNLDRVKSGTVLLSIETTKAISDIEAASEGFIQLAVQENEIVSVGSIIGWIKNSKDEFVKFNKEENISVKRNRITNPARNLATELGINIDELPADILITTEFIKKYSSKITKLNTIELISIVDPDKSIIIFGGGGHAKAVIELIQAIGSFNIIGILDDNIPVNQMIVDVPVIGTRNNLEELRSKGIKLAANAVGGIINTQVRMKICGLLEEKGFALPALIHPSATVERSAYIAEGVQVFANSYIGSEASIGNHSMVNTSAVVSHDCTINSYSHLSPGSLLSGHVHVGKNCLIGMGVTTTIGLSIGDGSRIGNGAILTTDVPKNSIIQNGTIWKG